jgi:hypothetical protein
MENRLVLKTGHQGEDVRILQELLGITPQDGIFGKKTREEVIKFQRTNNLTSDGIVGPMTWAALNYNPQEIYADTDEITSATWIERYHLPEGEYIKQHTSKKYIFIHHTAGRHNPYKTIDNWARDQRGRVGTNYVIGGLPANVDLNNLTAAHTKYDGRILQAIDDKYWGYHLGKNGSSFMTSHSLSIELNSAGGLTKVGDKYYTWFKQEVHPSQVVELDQPFRGYKYFHRYSDEQLMSLEALLYHLAEKHDINIQDGMYKMGPTERYEFNESAWKGGITGILSHTNVRKDKSDVFPQPELDRLINSFGA